MLKYLARWVFWEAGWLPLGPFGPYVLGLSIGRMPHRVIRERIPETAKALKEAAP